MTEYPPTPFGQLFASGLQEKLWKDRYDYEQILAGLVWLYLVYGRKYSVPIPSFVKLTWNDWGRVDLGLVQPCRTLEREVKALLQTVVQDKVSESIKELTFHLYPDKDLKQAAQAAGPLGKPSLRSYAFGPETYLTDLGWINQHRTYDSIAKLSGKYDLEFGSIKICDGWAQFWHRHWLGDVLVLELGEKNTYRLWDVCSQHARDLQWEFLSINPNLSHYCLTGLVRYRTKGPDCLSFYGPAYDGIVLNTKAEAEVEIEDVRSSLFSLICSAFVDDQTKSLDLSFRAKFDGSKVLVWWTFDKINDQQIVGRSIDSSSFFCELLRRWFVDYESFFPDPVENTKLIVEANIKADSRHEIFLLLEQSLTA